MLTNLTTAMVLDGVNAGLGVQASDAELASKAFDAKTLFASGFAKMKIEAGQQAHKRFSEHDRRVLKIFAGRLFEFDSPGALLSLSKGLDIRVVRCMDNRSLKTKNNMLIAQAHADGYNTQIKIAPSLTLVGDELLTHMEDGALKIPLMEPLEPKIVLEAVISLFYADQWEPRAD